jgi:hypothetical protein
MQRDQFQDIIDAILIPTARFYLSNFQCQVEWRENWQDILFNAYEAERHKIRDLMGLCGDQDRIDRHKVAAAFTIAMSKMSVLVAKGVDPSGSSRKANFAIAILCSVKIMAHIYQDKYADDPVIQSLLSIKFEFPHVATEKTYQKHLMIILENANKTPNCFNPFFLSNIYFLIEYLHLKRAGIAK